MKAENYVCTYLVPATAKVEWCTHPGMNRFVLVFVSVSALSRLRVDLIEGCFLGLFQCLHEISVFLGFSL